MRTTELAKGFFSEIGRRRVWRVALIYIVGAWVALQVADLAFPGLNVPESSIRYVWLAAMAGFPLALFLGWRFDLHDGRIVRTSPEDKDTAPKLSRADQIAVLATLAMAVTIFSIALVQIAATVESGDGTGTGVIGTKSIAVLPFRNMSGDEGNDAFTFGIHDDLLTHIAKISDIKVISRRSVMRLDTTIGIREIGRALGVATILEGGVQRVGDRLRINANLINVDTDQHIWADSFDRELTTSDIFDIQSEIASAIAHELQATLSPQDRTNLERRPTEDMQAYEAYLLGKQRLISRRGSDLRQAAADFAEAVRLDPEYTLAHVGLAEAHLLLENYGYMNRDEALTVATSALDVASSQDDELGSVSAVRGLLKMRERDRPAARRLLERAISLDPNQVSAYNWLGDMLVVLGQPKDAIPHLEKARSLDPLAPVVMTTLGEAYAAVGRFDEALDMYNKVVEIQPDYPGVYFLLGADAHTVRGNLVEAVKLYRQELVVDPLRSTTVLATAYLDLGDDTEAERWITRGLQLQPESFFGIAAQISLHRFRGERDAALSLARRLNEANPGNNASIYTLVRYGQFEEVVRDYSGYFPELDCSGEPQVNRTNFFRAMNISLAIEKTGNSDCAARILSALHNLLPDIQRDGINGYGFLETELFAREGQTDRALESLRRIVDGGRRAFFWGQVIESPHTESIRDTAEFQAIVQVVKEDMVRQLAQLRDLNRNGELPYVPDLPREQ